MNSTTGLSVDDDCKHEIAAILAHIKHETDSLKYVNEVACVTSTESVCTYNSASTIWPPVDGQRYFGRGAFQLSWNYNYGPFSAQAFNGGLDDKLVLLSDPDLVASDGFYAFASAMWFYMTPQSPKPSMHDVMTGYFTPNAYDLSINIQDGFGTTIHIINGGLECG